MSFTAKLQQSGGELVYLVQGKVEGGKPAWHYVQVEKMKQPLFLHQSKSGELDVADYGKILYSGWGKEPPEAIADSIKEQYNQN